MRSIRCRARLTIGRAALVSSLGATIAYAGQSETAVVGRVLDAVTANPIARATVALSGQDAIPMTTRTDATGHFVFGAVRDPMVYLRASRLGYVSGGFGQHAPGRRERAVYLRQGEANSVVLHLFKNSVVSGRVHESTGEVVVGARVRAFRETSQLGRRKFLPAGVAERSDDTGAYRLAGLLPGRYLIVAGPGTTDDEGRVSVFHPGRRSLTPDLVFDLEPAEERQHVNILMPGVSGVAITGAIVGLPQDRIVDVRLQHCDASNPPIDLDLARFRSVPPHRFRFQNLAPGVYCLRFASFPVGQFPRQQRGGIVVNRAGGTATGVPREVIMQDDSYFGSAQVGVVDTDVDGVNLAAETGARISGRVVIEDQAPEEAPADLPGISVLVYSADGTDLGDGMPVPGVDQMGRFTTPGLPLGKYVLDVRTSGRRLYLRHITLAGQDHTLRAVPLVRGGVQDVQITLTSRPTVVQGRVRDDIGKAALEAVVFAFPVSREQWVYSGLRPFAMRETRPDRTGAYRFVGLPQGEYWIAAVPVEQAPLEWRDASQLAIFAAVGARVRVRSGVSTSLDLRLAHKGWDW